MLLIESFIIAGVCAFIWACFAGIIIFASEPGGLLFDLRNYIIALIIYKGNISMLHKLYDDYIDFDEAEEQYWRTLKRLGYDNKLVKFITCQVCFTVNLSISIGLILAYAYNLDPVFYLSFIAFSYLFSQKV
jgi:hypothetical protein